MPHIRREVYKRVRRLCSHRFPRRRAAGLSIQPFEAIFTPMQLSTRLHG